MTGERAAIGIIILVSFVVIGFRQTIKDVRRFFAPRPQCPATLKTWGRRN
jgi:hypothetical protein